MEPKPAWDTRLPSEREKDFQARVVEWLALAVPSILVFQFGKPGGHREFAGGVPPGWPDLLLIVPGKVMGDALDPPTYLHIELKRVGKNASPAQVAMGQRITDAGGHFYVVSSLAALARILVSLGVKLRVEVS